MFFSLLLFSSLQLFLHRQQSYRANWAGFLQARREHRKARPLCLSFFLSRYEVNPFCAQHTSIPRPTYSNSPDVNTKPVSNCTNVTSSLPPQYPSLFSFSVVVLLLSVCVLSSCTLLLWCCWCVNDVSQCGRINSSEASRITTWSRLHSTNFSVSQWCCVFSTLPNLSPLSALLLWANHRNSPSKKAWYMSTSLACPSWHFLMRWWRSCSSERPRPLESPTPSFSEEHLAPTSWAWAMRTLMDGDISIRRSCTCLEIWCGAVLRFLIQSQRNRSRTTLQATHSKYTLHGTQHCIPWNDSRS